MEESAIRGDENGMIFAFSESVLCLDPREGMSVGEAGSRVESSRAILEVIRLRC